MRKLFCFLSMYVFVIASVAQTPENAIAAVYYNVSHVIDSTQPASPNKEEGVLFIGKNTSFYTSYTNMRTLQSVKEYRAAHPESRQTGWTANFGFPVSFYKGISNSMLQSISMLQENVYILEEKAPQIDWKISDETKIIAGYACQKASATFQGRFYEAWFSPKLPFNNGPWKLGGLPGLILEASDDRKEIVFTFKSFDDTSTVHIPITLPDNTIKTTRKDLERAIKGLQASQQMGGGTVSFAVPGNSAPVKRKQYNNPIQKEEL
jgi:GLPGLI family protein